MAELPQPAVAREWLETMTLIRRFEERAGEMYARAKVGGFLPSASRRFRSSSKASLLRILPSSNLESPGSLTLTHSFSRSLTSRKANLSMTDPGSRPVSPIVSTFTLRSICDTMISMCLSSMSTRWLR